MPERNDILLRRSAIIAIISIMLLITVVPVVQSDYRSPSDGTPWSGNSEQTVNQSSVTSSIVASRAPPLQEKILVVKATFGPGWGINTNTLRSLFVNDVKSYYLEVSYNQVLMNTTYIDINYTMSQPEAYYGLDVGNSEPNVADLVYEALHKADGDVNATGGYQVYRHIVIVHSGTDQAVTHVADDITSQFMYSPGSELFTIHGVKIMNACVVSEYDPLGVAVHELGHSQGLPDLYNYASESTGDTFMGNWDLMAAGSWNPNGQGTSPSHPSTWCKIKLGWIKPAQIASTSQSSINVGYNATVLLDPQELQNPTLAIKILLNNGTYYLVEVRMKVGYDAAIPGSGVLVLFCDESKGSGEGIVQIMSAHYKSLGPEAAFNVGYPFQPFYGDKNANIGVKIVNKWSNGTFKVFIGSYNSALNEPIEYQDTTILLIALLGGVAVLVVIAVIVYIKKGRQKTGAKVYESVPVVKLS